MSETLNEWVAAHNEEALLADGFEDALIGVALRCGEPAVVEGVPGEWRLFAVEA